MSRRFLIMTLAAPIASFGELAGHERRGGRERPSKSAIVGLLGAALGVHRDDETGQKSLARGYDIAVLVNNPGQSLQDYHTVQSLAAARNFHPRTRAEALRNGKRETTITRRDYRTEVHYRIAIEALPGAHWSLEDVASALERPHFTLFLGRKSCPLSLPIGPWIGTAEDIVRALQQHDTRENADLREHFSKSAITNGTAHPYVAITETAFASLADKPNLNTRIERVNDQPLDRQRWHFTDRREVVFTLARNEEDGK